MFLDELEPKSSYLESHKSGKLNLAGSIKNVLADLDNGVTFSASSMNVFLRECGATVHDMADNYHRNGVSEGKVTSSLANIASRDSGLTRRFASYYEITTETKTPSASSISNPEPKKNVFEDMSDDDFISLLYD